MRFAPHQFRTRIPVASVNFVSNRLSSANRRFLSFVATLLVCVSGCEKSKPPPSPSPPEVEVITVVPQDVPVHQEWIGSLDGFVNAQIRAQVSGYLMSQNYKEGAFVKKGEVLFQIDPRLFEAELDQAKAQLGMAEAQLGKTELDVRRFTPLAKENAMSQEELDDAIQANLVARAGVAAAKSTVERARLNLEFSKLTSPVDGIAGVARAQIGNLVGPASGDLTVVSTLDPIKAYINVSEQYYLDHLAGYLKDGGQKGDDLELELILSNGSVYPHKGKFYFLDRQVENGTGAIQVAALFPNPGNVLRPGQYARVRARTELRKGVVLVPQRAVTELQGSFQVDVVGNDNKVSIRSVRVGEQMGKLWIIEAGLKSGERVIVEGLQKVPADAVVNPRPVAEAATNKG
jgi:membrane fusion protein (multidrug efflux system)